MAAVDYPRISNAFAITAGNGGVACHVSARVNPATEYARKAVLKIRPALHFEWIESRRFAVVRWRATGSVYSSTS